MSAHDRTLLANLGFRDPDKGDHRHDLACRYLAAPEQALALARKLIKRAPQFERVALDHMPPTKGSSNYEPTFDGVEVDWRLKAASGRLEVPLSKGIAQYKATIGFLDVLCAVKAETLARGKRRTFRWRYEDGSHGFNPKAPDSTAAFAWGQRDDAFEPDECWIVKTAPPIIVEVKAKRVEANTILRQVNLYREYIDNALKDADYAASWAWTPRLHWVVATLFDLAADEAESLRAHEITPIRLGPKFDTWAAEQSGRTTSEAIDEI